MPDHTFAVPTDELEERGLLDINILTTRIDYMASSQKLDPFTSSPSQPPKCSLRGEWENEDGSPGKMQLRTFRGLWGAKKLYDFWTDHKQVKWLTPTKLVTEDGMTIQSPELEKIVEYELSREERSYVWPEPFNGEVTHFKNKTSVKTVNARAEHSKPDKPAKEPRKAKEKKERVPRPSKDGLVSIGEIAQELKIEPRIARGVLRDTKTPKPDAGWAWPKDQVEKIKSIIKKGMK